MTLSTLDDAAGVHSLTFPCGELPADSGAVAAGHEPNGHFWEEIAQVLATDVTPRLELDSEGSMFCAFGSRTDLLALQAVLEPVLASAEALQAVIASAEAAGYVFEE